jgi:hypothetical protein
MKPADEVAQTEPVWHEILLAISVNRGCVIGGSLNRAPADHARRIVPQEKELLRCNSQHAQSS